MSYLWDLERSYIPSQLDPEQKLDLRGGHVNGGAGEETVEERLNQVRSDEAELEEEHDRLNDAHPEGVRHHDHHSRLLPVQAEPLGRVVALRRVSGQVSGRVETDRRRIGRLQVAQVGGHHERDDGERADGDVLGRAKDPVDENGEEGRVEAVDGRKGRQERVGHSLRNVHDP